MAASSYRILAFDGGGVGGVVATTLLDRLVEAVPDLMDGVDLLAGTSTGAVIALGLASGMSPREVDGLYNDENLRTAFDPYFRPPFNLGFWRPKYDNRKYRDLLAESIPGDPPLGLLPRRVVLGTTDLFEPASRRARPRFMHNFPGSSWSEVCSSDAALRSSAAPLVWPSHQGFVDGWLAANNPSLAAIASAVDPARGGRSLADLRLLSFGVGDGLVRIEGERLRWGFRRWMWPFGRHPLRQMAVSFVAVTQAAHQLSRQFLGDERYRRIDVELEEEVALDNVRKASYLRAAAEGVDIAPWVEWIERNWCEPPRPARGLPLAPLRGELVEAPSDAFLDSMREVADPEADRVIAAHFRRYGRAGLKRLSDFLQNSRAPASAAPSNWVRAFLTRPVEYPDWVDFRDVNHLRDWFHQHGISSMLVLFLKGLPQYFAAEGAAHVFHRANLFDPRSLSRFAVEIAQLVYDLMTPEELRIRPDRGYAVVALEKLRLHHSLVRNWVEYGGDEPWREEWGRPINQEDLAMAVVAFATFVVEGVRQLDIEVSEDVERGALQAWSIMGFHLGLDQRLIRTDPAQARRLLARMGQRHWGPSRAGRELVRQLVALSRSIMPWPLKGMPLAIMNFLMERRFREWLDLPRATWPTRWALGLLYGIGRRTRVNHLLARVASHFMMRWMGTTSVRQGDRGEFRPPSAAAPVQDSGTAA